MRRLRNTRGTCGLEGPGVGAAPVHVACRADPRLLQGIGELDRGDGRQRGNPAPCPSPGLLPAWAQKGTVPSLCTRCGPLKLYLYSKRRCGRSAALPAVPGAAASPPMLSLPTNWLKDSSRAQKNDRAPAWGPFRQDPAILDSGTQRPAGEGGALETRMANRALTDWWSPGDPRARMSPAPGLLYPGGH